VALPQGHEATAADEPLGTQFPRFTGPKLQILTQKPLDDKTVKRGQQVLSLLALLVQQYKY
jgi:hypothetical protein